jgi:hypothetical protein
MIIVTGLPRSGTSMIMQILEKGGLSIATDNKRVADEHNPKGYYEIEKVVDYINKKEQCASDNNSECCIKVLSPFLKKIEGDHRFIFVERNLDECFASMRKMLKKEPAKFPMMRHLKEIKEHLKDKDVIYVNYNEIIETPDIGLLPLKNLIPHFEEAKKAIDPKLYRNRQTT